jgi:hypothetical protein
MFCASGRPWAIQKSIFPPSQKKFHFVFGRQVIEKGGVGHFPYTLVQSNRKGKHAHEFFI